jgi:hypothetical protein
MGASEKELLTTQMFFKAAFPVMKVPLSHDPKIKKQFEDIKAKVVICANNDREIIGCTLVFDNGDFKVEQQIIDNPDIKLHFSSVEKMNKMFRGGNALPSIKGFSKPSLLIKVFMLLMSLKLMMPNAKVKDALKKFIKVKMSLYMITTALSILNKSGSPEMRNWTEKQPDRIYQFTVEPFEGEETGIAAYLRVKGGKSKAGRGIYTRRRPFVHFRFNGVDGAYSVLQKEVEFVSGVEKGCVIVEGSPEYSSQLNDFMSILQGMLT